MWKIIIIIVALIPLIYFAIKTGKFIEKDENIMNLFQKKEMDISKYPKTLPKENLKFLTYLSLMFLFSAIVFGLIIFFYT